MDARMKFGIFLGPFHTLGENPTLAIERDIELIQWLDQLGYDEVWIGEHHSAGWETISSPELMIAMAAPITRRIMLGSGVTSLPYHNPLMVANRFVQLDHMTRGRAMLGCGPGALSSDAYMLNIPPTEQRRRMEEALSVIMRLLAGETVTIRTDWFELRDARLHLAPYTRPHFPIAIASTITPFGMMAAGKHGVGVLSIGAGLPGGPEALGQQWQIAEDSAAQHGKRMDRGKWRIVVNMHVAEDDEEALAQVRKGERVETIAYFDETLGRPAGRWCAAAAVGVVAGAGGCSRQRTQIASKLAPTLGYQRHGVFAQRLSALPGAVRSANPPPRSVSLAMPSGPAEQSTYAGFTQGWRDLYA